MKPKRGILLGAVVAAVAVAAVMGYNLYRHPAAFRTLTDGTLPAQAVQARREQLAERDDLRVLVAYFSHSGTTKGVATALSQQVGADLFAITPQAPYTNVYTQSNREIRTGARPALAGELPNLADYDVVFVGYPVWWHATPAPVTTFLAQGNLSHALVIPFCTSGSSDIAETLPTFLDACPGAAVYGAQRIAEVRQIPGWLAQLDLPGLFPKKG